MAQKFRGIIGGVLLAALTAPATAATLESELANLLYDHPQIRSAMKSLESARKEIDRSKSSYYPTVSATTDTGYELIDSPSERSSTDGQGGKPSSRTPYTANLTVSQNLFNGFLTDSQVRTARLNKEISKFELETTRQNTLFSGANAYIDVLRQQRLVELATANEATIQRQLNLEDERVQRGSRRGERWIRLESQLGCRRVPWSAALWHQHLVQDVTEGSAGEGIVLCYELHPATQTQLLARGFDVDWHIDDFKELR